MSTLPFYYFYYIHCIFYFFHIRGYTVVNHSREFKKRVENLSHFSFSENEINRLRKELQFNLPHTDSREWLENLILETETAISKVPLQDQDNSRHLAKINIGTFIKKDVEIT
jgi:hypothetical protein